MTLEEKMEDSFAKMQSSLSKFARSNDRRMVLRALRDVKYLLCLSLEPVYYEGELKELEDEVANEHVILNGIPFHGNFLVTLQQLCSKMCEGVALSEASLYASLIVRMARTVSAADSYFKLNSLLGSADLMLMPTQAKVVPINLNLYSSMGTIHATISTVNFYGLFRKADIKPADLGKGSMSGRPWISIQATIDERVNLSTKEGVRHMKVKLPESLY